VNWTTQIVWPGSLHRMDGSNAVGHGQSLLPSVTMLKKINIIPCQAYGLHIFGKRNVFFLIISIISQIFIRKTFKIRVPWKNLYFRMTAIFVWPPSWKKVFFRMPPFLNFIRVGWRITMQSLLLLLKSAQFDYFVCLIRCTNRRCKQLCVNELNDAHFSRHLF